MFNKGILEKKFKINPFIFIDFHKKRKQINKRMIYFRNEPKLNNKKNCFKKIKHEIFFSN